jgi:hypothetical protein
MARVIIPLNPDLLIHLLDSAIEKEQQLAPNGTLTPQELNDLENLRSTAKKSNDEQQKLYKKAEELTVTRNNALGITEGISVDQPGTAMYLITALRDLLLARNKQNPKVLGEWGFNVDDSPQKKGDVPPTPPTL